MISPVKWEGDKVLVLDQRKLPFEEEWVELKGAGEAATAIREMVVRGAPLIGVVAALGLAAEALRLEAHSLEEFLAGVRRASDILKSSRPTAYNLFWAVDRVVRRVSRARTVEEGRRAAVEEALSIMREDVEANMRIGQYGAEFIGDGDTVLTHCNAGALATAGYGTALGVVRAAVEQGKAVKVIATETRPFLQGARLTVFELKKDGIPVTLIPDSAVGYVIEKGLVDEVVVGADRVFLSGHVINKVGTYPIAAVAGRHGVPFYVAAPTSTIDPKGEAEEAVIELRGAEEVRRVMGKPITLPDVDVINPAFDLTPPDLVSAIITERGVAGPPYPESLSRLLEL